MGGHVRYEMDVYGPWAIIGAITIGWSYCLLRVITHWWECIWRS